VRFIGPAGSIAVTEHGFSAESPLVGNSTMIAPALIDAWMPVHGLLQTRDPLAQSILSSGRARGFRIPTRNSGRLETTRAFDVDGETGRVVRADGTLDAAIHVAGIPVDDALHDTIISPMPGTDPPMLRETDRVARSALRAAGVQTVKRRGPSLVPIP
jgi:hypothetical protein